jgi:hypothetical protein
MKTNRLVGISDHSPPGYHSNNSSAFPRRILRHEGNPVVLGLPVEVTVIFGHGAPTLPGLLLGPRTVNADGGPAIVASKEQLYGVDKQLE